MKTTIAQNKEILINELNTDLINKNKATKRIQANIRGSWTRLSLKLFNRCKSKGYFNLLN